MEDFYNSPLLPLAIALMQYGAPSREPKNFGRDLMNSMHGMSQMQRQTNPLQQMQIEEIRRKRERENQWREVVKNNFQTDEAGAKLFGQPVNPAFGQVLPYMDDEAGIAALLKSLEPRKQEYHAPAEFGVGGGMQQRHQFVDGKWVPLGEPYPQFNPQGDPVANLAKTLGMREEMAIRAEDRKAKQEAEDDKRKTLEKGEADRQARIARINEARKIVATGAHNLPETIKTDALADLEPYTGNPDVERQQWIKAREQGTKWKKLPAKEQNDVLLKLKQQPNMPVKDINGNVWMFTNGKTILVR